MKKILIGTAALALAAGTAVSIPGTASAATCSVSWGSAAKTVTNDTHTTMSTVRAGKHTCYDRMVIDMATTGAGYSVRYVSAVRDQGQGAVVPLAGGAFLQIDVQAAANAKPAMPNLAGYPTFRQAKWGGSFEGYSTVGLGVRARLPFRVFKSGPDLVIDVAPHW